MRRHGVLMLAEPSALKAPGCERTKTWIGVGETHLVIHQPGGVFSSVKELRVDAAQVELSIDDVDDVSVTATVDGYEGRLHIAWTLARDSVFLTALKAVCGGETASFERDGLERLGLCDAVVLGLADDPRQPPTGRHFGMARSTPVLYVAEDGGFVLDDPHHVVAVAGDEVLALQRVDGAGIDARFVDRWPGGWVVGMRLKPGEGELSPTGRVAAVVAGPITANLEGREVSGTLLVRTDTELRVRDDAGWVGAIAIEDASFSVEASTLLVHGSGESLSMQIPEDVALWAVRGLRRASAQLIRVVSGPVPAGAGTVRVEGSVLHLETAESGTVDLSKLDPDDLVANAQDDGVHLHLGELAVLRGAGARITALRADIAAGMGADVLSNLDTAELYRRLHRLRSDRWLWLLFGPIFLTDHMLADAGRLPAEDGEDHEHLRVRRLISQTLIVSEQLRSVRLRLGAAAVALPYALLDEEAAWLDAVAPGRTEQLIGDLRGRVVGGLRGRIRGAQAHLAFAMRDVEEAVRRLEVVHHPRKAGNTHVLGRVGLGAAMLLLSPISGTITIASAVAGKLTDHLSSNSEHAAVLERFGPRCVSSWELLVNVTALAAVETSAWLDALWADTASRDRAAGVDEARLREALTARIQELASKRQEPLPIEGLVAGDLCVAMREAMQQGPFDLVEGLTR